MQNSNTNEKKIIYPIEPDFIMKNQNYVGYSVISLYQNKTHYSGHYLKYINKLNELIESDSKYKKIFGLVKKNFSYNNNEEIRMLLILTGIKLFDSNTQVYRNSSQIYNHDLYWKTLTTESESSNSFNKLKNTLFGSDQDLKIFQNKFIDEGTKHFGSGWLWIYKTNGILDVFTTHDSAVPFDSDFTDKKILGVIDLWEHAYYLDYQSDRKKYLEESFKVLDWNKFI